MSYALLMLNIFSWNLWNCDSNVIMFKLWSQSVLALHVGMCYSNFFIIQNLNYIIWILFEIWFFKVPLEVR